MRTTWTSNYFSVPGEELWAYSFIGLMCSYLVWRPEHRGACQSRCSFRQSTGPGCRARLAQDPRRGPWSHRTWDQHTLLWVLKSLKPQKARCLSLQTWLWLLFSGVYDLKRVYRVGVNLIKSSIQLIPSSQGQVHLSRANTRALASKETAQPVNPAPRSRLWLVGRCGEWSDWLSSSH